MNKTYYLGVAVIWIISLTLSWAFLFGPLNYQNREQSRLESAMPANELKDLVTKCHATGGTPRGRLVTTGPNVGQVNIAYCEYNDEMFGIVRINGDIETKSDFIPLVNGE